MLLLPHSFYTLTFSLCSISFSFVFPSPQSPIVIIICKYLLSINQLPLNNSSKESIICEDLLSNYQKQWAGRGCVLSPCPVGTQSHSDALSVVIHCLGQHCCWIADGGWSWQRVKTCSVWILRKPITIWEQEAPDKCFLGLFPCFLESLSPGEQAPGNNSLRAVSEKWACLEKGRVPLDTFGSTIARKGAVEAVSRNHSLLFPCWYLCPTWTTPHPLPSPSQDYHSQPPPFYFSHSEILSFLRRLIFSPSFIEGRAASFTISLGLSPTCPQELAQVPPLGSLLSSPPYNKVPLNVSLWSQLL